MSTLFAVRALLFAGECFAASAILLSLAWLACLFVKQAGMRHFIWLTAFGVSLVLPIVAFIVPPSVVLHQHADVPTPVPVYVEVDAPVTASAVPLNDPAPAAVPAPKPSWHFDMRDAAIGLFALWLAGFCWAALRLSLGALGLSSLRQQSRPHTLINPSEFHSGPRECELRLSLVEDGPITWGLFRPVILLPKSSRAWPRARLHAVLLHELAHVRRRDCVTQTLSLLACALYWANPLMWIGARMLRREAEIAADDAVIESGVRPSVYAGELLQLATEFRGRRAALSGVSMAAPSALEARVKSVLAPNNLRTGVTPMDALKIAVLGVAATALLALARPDVVAAQDAVAQPAPVAAPTELPPVDAIPTVPDAPPPPPAPRHHHVHVAQSATPDAPPAPPASPAPEAMSAPPAPPPPPAMHAVPPVPPVPTIALNEDDEDVNVDVDNDDDTVSVKGDKVVKMRVWRDKEGHRHVIRSERFLSPADKARIHEEVARAQVEARRAEAEVARVQPEIDKALAAAKINEKVAKAMREAEPRIRAEIDRAMAEAKPEIRRAMAEAHINEKVMKALRDAQPKIDAAIAKAHDKEWHARVMQEERDDASGKDDEADNDNYDSQDQNAH
jgi:beta-lactamase regulating signal transducer with metallopeptidase domain